MGYRNKVRHPYKINKGNYSWQQTVGHMTMVANARAYQQNVFLTFHLPTKCCNARLFPLDDTLAACEKCHKRVDFNSMPDTEVGVTITADTVSEFSFNGKVPTVDGDYDGILRENQIDIAMHDWVDRFAREIQPYMVSNNQTIKGLDAVIQPQLWLTTVYLPR